MFDSARMRGLYPSLADGWIYMNAAQRPQIPESVASATARGFRMSAVMDYEESASGSHGRAGTSVRFGADGLENSARIAVADLTSTTADAIIFGPSLPVLYERLSRAVEPLFRRGGEVVTSRFNTHAITGRPTIIAESDLGTGEVPPWQFATLITGSTRLVSLMSAHPLTGSMHDLVRMSEIIRATSRSWLLVDATPTLGFSSVTFEALGADIIALDLSVLGGPALSCLAFQRASMVPRLAGDVFINDVSSALMAGVIAAIEHLADMEEQDRGSRRRRLERSVYSAGEYLTELGHYLDDSLQHISSVYTFGLSGELAMGSLVPRLPRATFCIPGLSAETIHQYLVDNRVVSTLTTLDPLLVAMGLNQEEGAITCSLAPYNTRHDIDRLVQSLAALVEGEQ
ncbi:aminotransferase class V-fold PLP-dependent enzyme [Corynebacterium sp. ES2715-CONJ3]|uniref:aminotransferase class V-fold PLP-dependent enzyme n=1 Tax=Corynebacterium sp. ES2715-CONJ3 TaxID=2974028 RepID=UPI00216AB2B2|nr:aminotransferase class V-fold PLP-dependent enzyme [Corynebacterium sp. ES2715-CONJ3]